MRTLRAKIGDKVRLYGHTGQFELRETTSRFYDFEAFSIDKAPIHFGAVDSSIVEINGKPLPLLSAPLSPPADDYPHWPVFDYTDGPQQLALDAIANWRRTNE